MTTRDKLNLVRINSGVYTMNRAEREHEIERIIAQTIAYLQAKAEVNKPPSLAKRLKLKIQSFFRGLKP